MYKVYSRQESEILPETLQFLGPDKVRERDPVLRLMCVEILMLLATSEFIPDINQFMRLLSNLIVSGFTGREALRNRGTYTVIKIAHEAETDGNVSGMYQYAVRT